LKHLYIHPCLQWDSNPPSPRLSRRRYSTFSI
jgi:hypothetical protein